MSLSSRSASISALLPSMRSMSVRLFCAQSAGSAVSVKPGDVGDEVVAALPAAVELGPEERGVPQAEADQLAGRSGGYPRAGRAGASRTRRSRCSGTRGCCSPAACGASRRRRGASGVPRERSSVARKFFTCAVADRLDRRVAVTVPPRRSSPPGRGWPRPCCPSPFSSLCLLRVAHEVVQGEPVVGGDEVDAVKGLAAVAQVQVGAARPAAWRDPARFPRRHARSGARRRGSGRSIPPTGPRGTSRPGRRPRRPTPRR